MKSIRVFYDTSPEGFTLRENELKVEKGYKHQILGRISVRITVGSCNIKPYATKSNVIHALKEQAAKVGANAIIYAWSALPDEISDSPFGINGACEHIKIARNQGPNIGSGWAVILHPGK